MALTSYTMSRARAVVDESSLERLPGAQIDWASVTAAGDGTKSVKAGTVISKMAGGLYQPRAYTLTLTSLVVATNVATATKAAHGFSVGEQVYISGSNLAYANGLVTIATVPDADTFTYAATGSNATATGTIVVSRAATAILETDAQQSNLSEAYSGYGALVGGVLYANLLPDATGTPKVLPAQYVTELKNAGCTFKYAQYADTRAS